MSPQAHEIIRIVQRIVIERNAFVTVGPGHGNNTTNAIMQQVNLEVSEIFGANVIEKAFLAGVRQNVDFYIAETKEVVEVEFSLKNPYPCLEKDSMKILLAKDAGHKIDRLILVGDPGSAKRLSAPAPQAIISYLKRSHGLTIEIFELTEK